MGFLQRLFGRQSAAPAPEAAPPTVPVSADPWLHVSSTRGAVDTPHAVRRELARICLRDTLHHNGIPSSWVRADPLTMVAEPRGAGVHLRLLVLHWEPRLMVYAAALQQYLERRIHALDPSADEWLLGISWQLELPAGTPTPPLPHPGSWTAPEGNDARVPGHVARPASGEAGVISGPTRIGTGEGPGGTSARARLERLMADRDERYQPNGGHPAFEATQPMRY